MLAGLFGKKKEENIGDAKDCVAVAMTYNMKTGTLSMTTKAPTLVLLGMFELAKQIITKKQIMNELTEMAAQQKVVPATSLEGLPPAPSEKGV